MKTCKPELKSQENQELSQDNMVDIPVVTRRRQFTAAYKLRILNEIEASSEPGHCASIARREGLYSSTITKWREWRTRMEQNNTDGTGKRAKSKGPKVNRNQLRKLERENQRLKLKLKKTEGLIELQKKALELLEDLDLNGE
jgi:transposase